MEIIPSINCQDFETASERAKKIGEFASWAHLDISDARFTFNKSWGDPLAWQKIGKDLNFEVHLMVEKPEKEIDEWIAAGARRIIIHAETTTKESLIEIKKKADNKKVELMLAANPETPVEKLLQYSYSGGVSEFQILAVHPGLSGQNFQSLVADKIKFLRSKIPTAIIEVDGGINEEAAKISKSAGADILISDSYIFHSENPAKAYEKLKAV